METKQGVEIGVGGIGVSVQKKIKEEDGSKILSEEQGVFLGLFEFTNTKTTPIDEKYRKVGRTRQKSESKASDLGFKAKVIIGVEVNLDLNRIWNAFGNLLLEK